MKRLAPFNDETEMKAARSHSNTAVSRAVDARSAPPSPIRSVARRAAPVRLPPSGPTLESASSEIEDVRSVRECRVAPLLTAHTKRARLQHRVERNAGIASRALAVDWLHCYRELEHSGRFLLKAFLQTHECGKLLDAVLGSLRESSPDSTEQDTSTLTHDDSGSGAHCPVIGADHVVWSLLTQAGSAASSLPRASAAAFGATPLQEEADLYTTMRLSPSLNPGIDVPCGGGIRMFLREPLPKIITRVRDVLYQWLQPLANRVMQIQKVPPSASKGVYPIDLSNLWEARRRQGMCGDADDDNETMEKDGAAPATAASARTHVEHGDDASDGAANTVTANEQRTSSSSSSLRALHGTSNLLLVEPLKEVFPRLAASRQSSQTPQQSTPSTAGTCLAATPTPIRRASDAFVPNTPKSVPPPSRPLATLDAQTPKLPTATATTTTSTVSATPSALDCDDDESLSAMRASILSQSGRTAKYEILHLPNPDDAVVEHSDAASGAGSDDPRLGTSSPLSASDSLGVDQYDEEVGSARLRRSASRDGGKAAVNTSILSESGHVAQVEVPQFPFAATIILSRRQRRHADGHFDGAACVTKMVCDAETPLGCLGAGGGDYDDEFESDVGTGMVASDLRVYDLFSDSAHIPSTDDVLGASTSEVATRAPAATVTYQCDDIDEGDIILHGVSPYWRHTTDDERGEQVARVNVATRLCYLRDGQLLALRLLFDRSVD